MDIIPNHLDTGLQAIWLSTTFARPQKLASSTRMQSHCSMTVDSHPILSVEEYDGDNAALAVF